MNPSTKPSYLSQKIQALREKMLYIGNTKGLNHPETLEYSRKLDKLIIKYQRNKQH
ncbi:aspartyl-phosphate phosphatase Spo0E family protein [Bacillus sp. REN3]|uniref:aspartyl-phosphate phosphatase Spo0E family protein n=1 Tax=Bacillus sp. REN3 TaxID=2802440 RepID=UPI001AEDD1F9|nr:aspartyl-phosphate phosphatase Spo0E family protein [Bacillus sp. REN3]